MGVCFKPQSHQVASVLLTSASIPSTACVLPSPLCFLLLGGIWRTLSEEQGGRCGPSLVRISHCLFCQLLQEGQGKPDKEIPCILSQLREQVGVASTPTDLQELLHVVTLLANVVTETRAELTESALKVSSRSLIGSQLGRVEGRLFHYERFCLSGIMWAAQQGTIVESRFGLLLPLFLKTSLQSHGE